MDEVIEEKIDNTCSNTEKNNIERCSDLYNNDDKDYMKKLYNESELIILNNSQNNFILENKNLPRINIYLFHY